MEKKAGYLAALSVLAAALLASLVLFLTSVLPVGRNASKSEAKAAPVNPQEPTKTVACPVADCGRQAILIENLDQLAYVIAKGGGDQATDILSGCYVLSAPEEELDLSLWNAVGIGKDAEGFAFSGHFCGQGQRLTYRVDGTVGLCGLFPRIQGTAERPAVVSGFEIAVQHSGDTEANACGALFRHAQNAAISGIDAVQRFSANLAYAAGLGWSLGEAASISDCSVLLSPLAEGSSVSYYAGVAYRSTGSVENCRFALGDGVTLKGYVSGIAFESGGLVRNCASYFPETTSAPAAIAAGDFIGGICGKQSGGSVESCRAQFNLAADSTADGVGGISGAVWDSEIKNCTVTGSHVYAGTNVGALVGSVGGTPFTHVLISGCETRVSLLSGYIHVGGLVGGVHLNGSVTIRGCTVQDTEIQGNAETGGLVGYTSYVKAGTAEQPVVFAMEDCHSFARSVTTTGVGKMNQTGGALGAVYGNFAVNQTRIANCTVWSDVTGAGSNVGGFVGAHFASEERLAEQRPEATYENCFAYGTVKTNGGWSVPDQDDTSLGNVGGFVGHVPTQAANVIFRGCVSYGNADGFGTTMTPHIGGFGGYLRGENCLIEDSKAYGKAWGFACAAGFIGRADNLTVKNSAAFGDAVLDVTGWHTAGFISYAESCTAIDCTASGSATYNGSDTSGSCNGGFLGRVVTKGTYTNCTAYGNVDGRSNNGGFVGNVAGEATFTGCSAYGQISSLGFGGDNSGGFLGQSTSQSTVTFERCTASGDVHGNTAGGFYGRLDGKHFNFRACVSYGSVYGDNPDITAGGFGGFTLNETIRVENCDSYGSVSGSANFANTSDSGGFFGPFYPSGEVINCNSYAATLTNCPANRIGGFICMDKAAAATTFTNCGYTKTPGNFDFFQRNFVSNTVTQNGTRVVNPVSPDAAGRFGLTLTAAEQAGKILINLSGWKNFPAGTGIAQLTLSVDGGKSRTLLVHSGYALISCTLNGAELGAGASVTLAADKTLSLLYPVIGAYPAGNIVVSVTLTNGFTKSITA